jgi:hypothetical protein
MTDVGKIMRKTNFRGPCTLEGPITGETAKLYVVQVDYSSDRSGYVGPRRFRKARVGMFSRWGYTTTHIEPCERCPDYTGR